METLYLSTSKLYDITKKLYDLKPSKKLEIELDTLQKVMIQLQDTLNELSYL